MALPTNYVDAVWDGNRKYQMIQNQDSTVSFTDETDYSVEGSFFGANDINQTNAQVNGLSTAKTITIGSTAWSSTTQTVNGRAYYVATISSLTIYVDNPEISIAPAGTVPTTAEEERFAALAYAVANVSGGSITFYAYTKPTSSISVLAKGVA